MDLIAAGFWPTDLSLGAVALLTFTCFFTSMLTAALGLGGGMMLLVVMASILPPWALIAVHGLVQLGANAGRTVLLREYVDKRLLAWFFIGSLVGIVPAAFVVTDIPASTIQIGLSLYILFVVWGPKLPGLGDNLPSILGHGAVSSFLTLFIGATGPLLASLFANGSLSRHGVVATHGACMTLQHSLKIVAFAAIGFAFTPWLIPIGLMVAVGFAGTYVGRMLLDRFSEYWFRLIFRIVLTALAIRLAILALF